MRVPRFRLYLGVTANIISGMHTPSDPSPYARRKFGTPFVWLLFAPVLSIGLVTAITALSGQGSGLGLAVILFQLTLAFMLACSILCGVRVGRSSGRGMGFLAFLGILIFYAAVAFAGCTYSVSIVK